MEKTTNALQTLHTEINTKVDASLGSLFTKDDVKNVVLHLFEKVFDIINDIEPQQGSINLDVVNNAIKTAISDYDFENEITIDNPRFSIDYSNSVELDSYDVDIHRGDLFTHISDFVRAKVEENNVNA